MTQDGELQQSGRFRLLPTTHALNHLGVAQGVIGPEDECLLASYEQTSTPPSAVFEMPENIFAS